MSAFAHLHSRVRRYKGLYSGLPHIPMADRGGMYHTFVAENPGQRPNKTSDSFTPQAAVQEHSAVVQKTFVELRESPD